MTAVYLARINYYPVKSLDGQSVPTARLLPSGAVEHDRQFAMFDASGEVINGKRTAAVQRIRSEFDPIERELTLRLNSPGPEVSFHVDRQRAELEQWLRLQLEFGEPLKIEENTRGGFPDDTDASGPTVISVATLEAVAGWFPGLTVDETRARFRPSLEIAGVPAFWEDQLFAGPGELVEFAVGEARLLGSHPCPRCVVPTRSSVTGLVSPQHQAFAKTFARLREEAFAASSAAHRTGESHFDHFYRLAVNTRPAGVAEATVKVGDQVRILGLTSAARR